MASNINGSNTTAPAPAFLCTQTRRVMRDPVLALCGHLFERSIYESTPHCPVDHWKCDPKDAMDQPLLRGRIDSWTAEQQTSWLPLAGASKARSGAGKRKQLTCRQVKVKKNAHQDDVHALVSIGGGRFVTGSKDTTCKIWHRRSGRELALIENKQQQRYKSWVTAAAVMSDLFWVYGTRDGRLLYYTNEGKKLSAAQFDAGLLKTSYQCKDRNRNRINCITPSPTSQAPKALFFGTPRFLHYFNGKRIVSTFEADPNDWVYCYCPLKKCSSSCCGGLSTRSLDA